MSVSNFSGFQTELLELQANDIVKAFRHSDDIEAFKVVVTSFVPYLTFLFLGYLLSQNSLWWLLLLAVPTHWFHARIFIIMHDCGHHSLFKSRFLNDVFGILAGLCYLTPFFMWRELHNKHHQNQGRLEKRGLSLDVWTMTRKEWLNSSATTKIFYSLYRNPFVLFIIAPLVLFLLIFRVPFEKFSMRALLNILILDAIILTALLLRPEFTFALITAVAPSLLMSYFAASFLFYIQHQYENTLWVKDDKFDNRLISLIGSSYLKLPPFFEWCYGFINYHHIHHLDTKIPMYRLRAAHQTLNSVKTLPALSPADAVKSVHLKVWNESTNCLESF